MNVTKNLLFLGGIAVVVGLIAAADRVYAATATTAADVCASNANPCTVTSAFDVTDGASLDFGTRTLSVSGGGKLDFGTGSGSILAGSITISTAGVAINAGGLMPSGGTSSGTVSLKARRACSGLDASSKTVACLDINDCQIGACGVRRCSGKTTKTCGADSDCQLGVCGGNKRCSGSVTVVRCATNADCNYGTCPSQLTCSGRAENPAACASNTDCNYGACSEGTASITMGGTFSGNSDSPAFLAMRAADNVTISKLINLDSSFIENDGGDLVVDAAAGSVQITAIIKAGGGGNAQGGTVEITAGTDVTIDNTMDVSGGDFDGGSVDVTSGRDITIGRSITANSTGGGGFGGEMLFDAGRDLIVNSVSAISKTLIQTNGSTDLENFAGDGGTQDYTSARHMVFNANTRLEGNGSAPDGYGSDLFFDVGADLTINGIVRANAGLGKGAGGFAEFLVGGNSTVGSTGSLELVGGEGGGGSLELSGTGNVTFAGSSDVSGSNGGFGGTALLDSGASASVSGTMFNDGLGAGSLEVDACRLTLTATGKIDNNAASGGNRLVSRESMKLLAGSAMTSDTGTNTLEYRTSAKPPVILGTVSPSPVLVVNGALQGCPVCGNAEIDSGESCDDGNTISGDGCSSTCQNEKCVQQTIAPGFPTVALCEDGDACTADVCNTGLSGGTCQHPAKNCDDSIACTADSCSAGTCAHAPNNSLCNDGNPCTDDFCAVAMGCGSTANTAVCSDGNTCTGSDICTDKVCVGAQIPGCGVCGDGQVNPPELCDDGNATFVSGEYCGIACSVLIPCGKPTNSTGTNPKSSDALFTLKAAVGQATCSKRVCDVDNSGKVLSSDALRILRKAVGQVVTLNCPTS